LSVEEKKVLKKKLQLKSFNQLPSILGSDPVAKYHDMRDNDVCEIIRPSVTTQTHMCYRVCHSEKIRLPSYLSSQSAIVEENNDDIEVESSVTSKTSGSSVVSSKKSTVSSKKSISSGKKFKIKLSSVKSKSSSTKSKASSTKSKASSHKSKASSSKKPIKFKIKMPKKTQKGGHEEDESISSHFQTDDFQAGGDLPDGIDSFVDSLHQHGGVNDGYDTDIESKGVFDMDGGVEVVSMTNDIKEDITSIDLAGGSDDDGSTADGGGSEIKEVTSINLDGGSIYETNDNEDDKFSLSSSALKKAF